MTTPNPKRRWYHVTPDRFFVGLLVMQAFLLLSEWFQWFPFNEHKGWTVLIGLGVVGVAVLVMLLWGLVCLCLRRRFQFGVRSLLVFVVAMSVPLGWFAWEMQKARRQREAVEAILGVPGTVSYDYEVDEKWMPIKGAQPSEPDWLRKLLGDDFFYDVKVVCCPETDFGDDDARHLRVLTRVQLLELSETQISDDGLRNLEGLTSLTLLLLGDTRLTDEGLQHLSGLAELKSLFLDGTRITDAGLIHLRCQNNYAVLSLGGTEVTDRGLEHLRGFSNLDVLVLSDTKTTDSGLEHLSGLTGLQRLWLDDTHVTDAGLTRLRGLTELELLSLYCTSVTDEGVKKLREALPNTSIQHGQPPPLF